ncbi:hypothetical protein V2J09_017623 [Rumex salicifolius]
MTAHCDTTVARMLVGNKCDLANIRAVSVEQGKKLAEEHRMFFMETSAQDATNVNKAFEMNQPCQRRRQIKARTELELVFVLLRLIFGMGN